MKPHSPSIPPDENARMLTQCSCGKMLSVHSRMSGKNVTCLDCGASVTVTPSKATRCPAGLEESQKKPKKIETRSLVAFFAMIISVLSAGVYYKLDTHWRHEKRINSANERLSKAIDNATEWLDERSTLADDIVERDLELALDDTLVVDDESGTAVLIKVRQQRLLRNAHVCIGRKSIPEAIFLLRKYLDDPLASDKPQVQRLLSNAEMAVSDESARGTLRAMSAEEFARFNRAGEVKNNRLLSDSLLGVWKQTLRRNLQEEVNRRELIRNADAERSNSQAVAANARIRAEEERKKRENDEHDRQQEVQRATLIAKGKKLVKVHRLSAFYAPAQMDIIRLRLFSEASFDSPSRQKRSSTKQLSIEAVKLVKARRAEILQHVEVPTELEFLHEAFIDFLDKTVAQISSLGLAVYLEGTGLYGKAVYDYRIAAKAARDAYEKYERLWESECNTLLKEIGEINTLLEETRESGGVVNDGVEKKWLDYAKRIDEALRAAATAEE